jgi:GTPase SAR1 family protein
VHEDLETAPPHALPIELGLAEQPDAVLDSYGDGIPPKLGRPKPLPVGTRLGDLFPTRFNRRCLVLGAAGAGKTTILLELARDLLARTEDGRDAPVPVMLLLSRWTNRPGGLTAWIAEEMAEHYKVDADQVRGWLAVGHLTLLLDGLDEVHPAQRTDCVQAINGFRRDGRCSLTGLVVSSRTADYVDLNTDRGRCLPGYHDVDRPDSNKRVSAANTARSAQDSRGRLTWRRSTATSWRSIRISALFDVELRASSPSQATNCRKIR